MIQAIIFDCFGVLLTDALSGLVEAVRVTDAAKADRIVALVALASAGRLDADASRAAVAAELGLSVGEYAAGIKAGEVRNQELFTYIQQLRPRYKTALLSNVIRHGLDVRFPGGELAEYFDVVVASGDVGYAKPAAQAYALTAERLGVRLSDCLMVDDREEYCVGARGVGMRAIRYESYPQLLAALQQAGIR